MTIDCPNGLWDMTEYKGLKLIRLLPNLRLIMDYKCCKCGRNLGDFDIVKTYEGDGEKTDIVECSCGCVNSVDYEMKITDIREDY